jgi:hypothetical protein
MRARKFVVLIALLSSRPTIGGEKTLTDDPFCGLGAQLRQN